MKNPLHSFTREEAERLKFFQFFEGKMTTRLQNALKNAFKEETTIAEVIEKDDTFYLTTPNLGRKCLRELRGLIGRGESNG